MYNVICKVKKTYNSRLQTTRETAVNMFHGCLVRKNYTARELPTHVSQFVPTIFSLNTCLRENPFDFVILPLPAQNVSKCDNTRNVSREVTTATWINLYTHFIYGMFSYCKHVSWPSRELCVAGFKNAKNCARRIRWVNCNTFREDNRKFSLSTFL